MKINLAKLKPKRTILYATETEIVYKQPETKLEKIWSNLEIQPISGKDDQETCNTKALYNKFELSKIELEICETVYKLKNDGKIGELELKTDVHKNNYSVKTKTVKDMVRSIDEYGKMLKNAISIENKTYQLIKELDYFIYRNELRVKLDDTRFLSLNNGLFVYPKNWEPLGVHCFVKYKNFVFYGFIKIVYEKEFEKIKNYFLEIGIIGEYKYNDIEILLQKENDSIFSKKYKIINNDKLCTFVVDLIKKKIHLKTIIEYLVCYLSKYFVKALMPFFNNKKYAFINIGNEILADGLSDVYVYILSYYIVKVHRKDGTFNIFINEQKINIT